MYNAIQLVILHFLVLGRTQKKEVKNWRHEHDMMSLRFYLRHFAL